MNVDISVIMSTYNTEQSLLTIAINSILNQTYKNFELIIVNDGGNNLQFLKSIDDKRVIIVEHETTKGLPLSLNEAIGISRGKYIARMDSDDYSLPFRLEVQKKYMDKHPDIDICGTYYKYFDQKTNYVINPLHDFESVKCQLFGKNALAHPTVMFRRSFLIKYNLRYSKNFKYSQDFELWTRCIEYGNIAILPKVCFFYRIHSTQISTNKKSEQMKLYEKILERNLQLFDIDKKNVDYLLMLNDMYLVDFRQLSNFIDLLVERNNKTGKFPIKKFKNIMYNYYFILLLKHKKDFRTVLIEKNMRNKILNFYNFYYLLNKLVSVCWSKFFILLYSKKIKEINKYV